LDTPSLPPISAYSPPPSPDNADIPIVQHITPYLHTHHVSTRASLSTTTWIAESTQTPVMTRSHQPLPL
jgi:hypothetical protein